jgi:two-component system, NtrC family, response regulator HydG
MSERVLIVDDDKDHAESIADLLQLRGFEVEVAYSGEQALQLFQKAPFDVSIMDVKLPGMNGVDAFFEFRKVRPQAQVIMMTGLSVEQLIASAVANVSRNSDPVGPGNSYEAAQGMLPDSKSAGKQLRP